MNSPAKQNRIAGFTLLELLVAVALMELLALSLYGSMHIAIKAKNSCVAAVKPSRSLVPAFEFISRDLACVLKPGGILAAEFEGTNDSTAQGFENDTITFYCSSYVPSDTEIASDIVKTEYSLQERNGWEGFALIRSRTTNLLSPRTLEPEQEVICRGIRELDIAYYDGYDWLGTWDSSTRE
ncbi:MAG: prepilin-type N-terminal cleavage/methylation domain-containing protein, partial [Anaerohalosphaera sp.]|nr:prepilin-type N-terminal cleavage/methylation domain-containing protein [Anaerohalosphaera sp.]